MILAVTGVAVEAAPDMCHRGNLWRLLLAALPAALDQRERIVALVPPAEIQHLCQELFRQVLQAGALAITAVKICPQVSLCRDILS